MFELVFIIILIGFVLIFTKPSAKSFNDEIRNVVRKARHKVFKNDSLTNMIMGGAISKMIRSVIQREVQDYILFSIGHWNNDHHWATYIGIFNSWICIRSDVSSE